MNNQNIADLTGIEDFTALNYLECTFNQLTNFDVSQNNSLTYLDCSGNNLTSLDVSSNTALTYLVCYSNQLTFLDISNNTALTLLSFSNNQIISLDLSNNTFLTDLYCEYNQLTSLDVSNNTVLIRLHCFFNQLECLNIKNGNNNNMIIFLADANPNLTCIEVDDPTWATQNWTNVDAGVTFSTNCNYPLGCFNINPNSVQEIPHSISLYPNPTNENITISIDNFNGNIQTQVYDLIGNRLQISNETTISLRDYARGIYLLKVSYGDKVEEMKVIKE
jgi:Leucine-rich repeat (LRR) protein